MDAVLGQVVTGVGIGAVLLLVALGLALTFGQMNVINMAHGEFVMAGAYTSYVLQRTVHDVTGSLLLAIPVGFLVAGLMGVALEAGLIRRLYGRPLDTLLVTWGVSLVLQQAARNVFGAPNVQVETPSWLTGGATLAGVDVPATRLFILALAVVCVTGVAVLLRSTGLGRQIRSVVQNRDLAECSGVPTARIDRTTFFLGSGLAGVAGVAVSLLGSIGPTVGTNYIVDAFLVVVAGGIGQLAGSICVAFALGILQSFVEYQTTASTAKLVVFIAIVAFLQARPQGLFTLRTRSVA